MYWLRYTCICCYEVTQLEIYRNATTRNIFNLNGNHDDQKKKRRTKKNKNFYFYNKKLSTSIIQRLNNVWRNLMHSFLWSINTFKSMSNVFDFITRKLFILNSQLYNKNTPPFALTDFKRAIVKIMVAWKIIWNFIAKQSLAGRLTKFNHQLSVQPIS